MVEQYARNARSHPPLVPFGTRVGTAAPGTLAHRVAQQLPPRFDQGANDGRTKYGRLRVALLLYIHAETLAEQARRGRPYLSGKHDHELFAPFDRNRLYTFLGRLDVNPSPPAVSKSLTRLEKAHLAAFYPPPEERRQNTPRTGAILTRYGKRVVEDNVLHYWPDARSIERATGATHEAAEELAGIVNELPEWARAIVLTSMLPDRPIRDS